MIEPGKGGRKYYLPIIMLTTSFIFAPFSTSPKKKDSSPVCQMMEVLHHTMPARQKNQQHLCMERCAMHIYALLFPSI